MTCQPLRLDGEAVALVCTRGARRLTPADQAALREAVDALRRTLPVLRPVHPGRVGCWRLIANTEDAVRKTRYFDLAGGLRDEAAAQALRREVVATTRSAWRLYWIGLDGSWSPYGVLYPQGPPRRPSRWPVEADP